MPESSSTEVKNLQNQLAAEREERKRVEAELQDIKALLIQRPPPQLQNVLGSHAESAAVTPDQQHQVLLPQTAATPAQQHQVVLPPADATAAPDAYNFTGNVNCNDNNNRSNYQPNSTSYYYNTMPYEQVKDNALQRILAVEQKWIASDVVMNNIDKDVQNLAYRIEAQEQYSKLYNLLIHGLKDNSRFGSFWTHLGPFGPILSFSNKIVADFSVIKLDWQSLFL